MPRIVTLLFTNVLLLQKPLSKSRNLLPEQLLVSVLRYTLPPGKFLIGCFGRSGKGQRVLLEADSMLADHHGAVEYFFAGEHLPERLGPFVEERPTLHGRVTLSPLVPHEAVPEYLKALDMIVMLPEREPFSNAVLEAMAMARPLILSRTLGNIEAIEDGVSGHLVDHDDRETLASLVRALVTDPGEAKRMGEAAAARVRRLFTEEVMMDRMEELWSETVKGGKERRGASSIK